MAAVAGAHHFDSDVRSHFVHGSGTTPGDNDPHALSDAVPTSALLVGALALEGLSDGSDYKVTGAMLEAATLATAIGLSPAWADQS